MVMLTKKAVVLAKVESVAGQDAVPVQALDAILVSEPDYTIDPNVLERDFVANDLSKFEHIIGRKLASLTFQTEFRGNGLEQSGAITDVPKIGTLLRGCGFGIFDGSTLITIDHDADWDIATNDSLTVANHDFDTSDGPFQFTGGTLPTGLVVATDYWVIKFNNSEIQFATTKALADAGTFIDLTGAPTGAGTLEDVRNIGRMIPDSANPTADNIQWNRGDVTDVTSPVHFQIEVITPGGTGVADVDITNNNSAAAGPTQSGLTLTDDTALALGTTSATITPDLGGASLAAGSKWRLVLLPTGVIMTPISDNHETLTLYAYFDGILLKIVGSMGTFDIEATAGDFARVNFTFTGSYVAATDAAQPDDPVYETTLPQQVELSLWTWGSNVTLVAEGWTFDAANDVVPRPDINAADGFAGVRISDRTPAGTVNPESELEATEPFWADFASAAAKTFVARVGTAVGNQVVVAAPKVQVSDLNFGDRDNIRTYEQSTLFKRNVGDDEVVFCFS